MWEWFEASIGPVHAAVGFAGLAAYWVPILSRKGGSRHVRFGRIFLYCAFFVLGSAGLSVIYHLSKMLLAGSGPREQPVAFGFFLFLGYLALVTFVTVRHALGVLHTKRDPDSLKTPLNQSLGVVSILASVGIISYALYFRPSIMILLLALSPIGLGVGYGIVRYLAGHRRSKRQWLYEHLGGMIGAGIAFHTAFAVFGATRVFDFNFEGWIAVIPWVLPAAVGIPATSIWTRYYQRKFGELAA